MNFKQNRIFKNLNLNFFKKSREMKRNVINLWYS